MEIKGTTKLTGVFGCPVKHSLSPVFQNAAFRRLGLDYVYIPLEVAPENLGKAVEAVRVFGFAGVNVTIPHKKNVGAFLDEIDPEAAALGAVNTVHNAHGRLKGYSTDGPGFLRSLKEDGGFRPKGKSALLFGAGGSAWALSAALIGEGITRLFICNRTRANAEELERHLNSSFGFDKIEIVDYARRHDAAVWQEVLLVVNTTSVGMNEGDETLVEDRNLYPDMFVYDIVYNRETKLLKAARKSGVACIDGLSMLVYQGAVSFEIWTGRPAPIEIMKQSLNCCINYNK